MICLNKTPSLRLFICGSINYQFNLNEKIYGNGINNRSIGGHRGGIG